ncbi:sodium/glutamate symporter [Faecalimicrobium dakarense]|uniref:sodium/glutamate symporter n=1 Tax=Faecalimicrobium dakarense TaxID=1301100 RepID=UPI0005AAB048|nr:sodium/glutamate symporter [[Clostridium] dakarense]
MLSISLDLIPTLILSILLFLLGNIIKNKSKLLTKMCIPSPVIGGLLFCVLSLLLRLFNICEISMNTSLMNYLICFFFTIVGLSVSISLVKKGGNLLIKYWLLCGVLAFGQNFLTLILSKLTNINPLLGLMCGTISMEGGHGTAAAYGATLESLGVENACSVGIAAATFGLILAGVLGGPVAKYLIEKNNLKSANSSFNFNKHNQSKISNNFELNPSLFLEQILVVLLCISFGELISKLVFNISGVIIPTISGCVLFAAIFRNTNDKLKFIRLNFKMLDFLSEISLGLFLTMALMSIDLFKLSSLFGPIVIIVISQAIFIVLFSIFIAFKVLGKNLDAAIIISGLIGHGLGATPNALANMTSVSQIYGYSEKAFLVVPLVAAFLLDVFTMPCIILFINLLA